MLFPLAFLFIPEMCDVEADAFLCVDACHVVVFESIHVARGIFANWKLECSQPHVVELLACSVFCLVVASLLCEAVNNARVLAVGSFVNCVIHIR